MRGGLRWRDQISVAQGALQWLWGRLDRAHDGREAADSEPSTPRRIQFGRGIKRGPAPLLNFSGDWICRKIFSPFSPWGLRMYVSLRKQSIPGWKPDPQSTHHDNSESKGKRRKALWGVNAKALQQ